MDEVDIDNVEDLNELESRLYGQIHHEATDETTISKGISPQGSDEQSMITPNPNNDQSGGNEKNYETSSNTNRILSKRYWASGEHAVKQSQQHQQNTNHRFIRNPFKPPNQQPQTKESDEIGPAVTTTLSSYGPAHNDKTDSSKCKIPPPNKNNENTDLAKNNSYTAGAGETATTSSNDNNAAADNILLDTPTTKSKKNKNYLTKTDQNSQPKQTGEQTEYKSNLKLNPVADWMKRNKKSNTNSNKTSTNSTAETSKQGPFAKQQQKLQKAKRLEEKKQKSKKAKNAASILAKKKPLTEIIDLDTDNESDSSDVIMIPVPAPPTFTVDDSNEDEEDSKESADIIEPNILQQEENALDSTDVQMSPTSSSFIKPQQISQHSLSTSTATNSAEKHLDNSSRCTSPCSIQSSDDFIGQNDRSRLLAGASGTADDEDLLVLTTDMNSLLEAPQTSTKKHNEKVVDDSCLELVEALEESSKFATPKTSKDRQPKKDYRVDQSQFKALDVYESESDITDSVYSKGTPKTTVIRQIDTSSDDDVEDISTCTQRTKRLRKRRASSSNKESESGINENLASSSDNTDNEPENDDNDLLRTAIPFIARGPAVERCKPRKRSRTLSSCSPITQTRKSAKTTKTSSPAHMSDGEFIATLNNLAQGQDDDEKEDAEEGADDSDTENVPSARDIAEKILAQHVEQTNVQTVDNDSDLAIPDEIYKELDKVFETIDNMAERESQRNSQVSPDEPVNISESSNSNSSTNIVYKSLPNEDTHIVSFIRDATSNNRTPETRHANNGSPIYNVIYSRGLRSAGGIGWNDEMRKFYNESWNGEHFVLKRVLQKMNPDKNLWKIYSEDRFNIKSNRRQNNLKCTNCCEFGHMRSKCKRPKKPMICYMCGDSGHHEPRCPNTICLRCGNKTQVFTKSCNACSYQNRLICPICKVRGHSLDYCPDKWRRYHSTTEPNDYPNSSIDYNPKKYCCICGGRGHLSDNCRSAVRFMEYPIIVSAVKSHQKSYGDLPLKSQHGGIGYNLMYEPCLQVKFDLVDRTTNDKYYGRFLNAVGLNYMLKRKRRLNSITTDTNAKKTTRLSTKYIANPYSKVGTANQMHAETHTGNAPNQVQEISESGNIDEQETTNQEPDIIFLEDNSSNDNDVELVGSTVEDNSMTNIQLNTIKESPSRKRLLQSFKSPTTVTSSLGTPTKSNTEPPLILDSDSNYSFSEHFDVPSTSAAAAAAALKTNLNESKNISTTEEEESYIPINEATNNSNDEPTVSPIEITTVSPNENLNVSANEEFNISTRPKPREMEALPDFIPLIDSTEDLEDEYDNESSFIGISRKFVSAESEDEDMDENIEQPRRMSPLRELPCEAKIYLTHFHSKYLLSPEGNNFLIKTSKAFKLRARLDFTSIGHVLVIFGLPSNQDKFQRELLLKYRELIDQSNQRQPIKSINVPKKADVLIRFLRDNITQLLNNLGNVNQLLQRLKNLERQQSKSGFKLAEKVRRSLNMILVGQAGLQDGSMHLDKLLLSLKTLINDYNAEDVAPQQLRTEITDHWKVIFTPYRHDNYQQLVETYNRLISKNRIQKLAIDPILLGQKTLDTTLTAEQKEKLEHPKMLKDNDTEQDYQVVVNPLNPKNSKLIKRKQTERVNKSPPPPVPSSKLKSTSTPRASSPSKAPSAPSMRLDLGNTSTPNKSKTSITATATTSLNTSSKKQSRGNSPSKIIPTTNTPITNKSKSTLTPTNNKSKSQTTTSAGSSVSTVNKKQSRPISPSTAAPTKRLDLSNTSTHNKTKSQNTTSTPSEISANKKQSRPNSPSSNTSTQNKSKSQTTTASTSAATTAVTKKQQHKIMPPPPFANPENKSTVSTAIQKVSDKWKSTCDTLLTEISAEPSKKKTNQGDSKLPSTFWSRESMRYLDVCVQLASTRSGIIEKLQRVQQKAKNGQLSYNDYLAVIKLHTALSGK